MLDASLLQVRGARPRVVVIGSACVMELIVSRCAFVLNVDGRTRFETRDDVCAESVGHLGSKQLVFTKRNPQGP